MSRINKDHSGLHDGIDQAIGKILLDFGVSANMTLGQRAIFALGAEFRNRLNGLYMATFFVGSAVGSAVGGWDYAQGGWTFTSWIGFALPVVALLYSLSERAAIEPIQKQ